MLIIKSRQKKRTLGLNEPLKHGSHKRPVTRRDFLAQGFITGSATVVAPCDPRCDARARARRVRTLQPDMQFLADQHHDLQHPAGRGQDPVHLLRPRGRREHRRLQRAGRQGGRPARLPVDAGLLEARPARRHAAEQRHDGLHQRRVRPDVSLGQRVPARHAREDFGHDARWRERRGDRGALRERHRQQPAQPDVRHREGRFARRAADADRLAELRLGRQLDGAGDADGSGESPDQDRSRLGCERPGRHRRARHAVHACPTVSRTRPRRSRSWSRWRASASRSC